MGKDHGPVGMAMLFLVSVQPLHSFLSVSTQNVLCRLHWAGHTPWEQTAVPGDDAIIPRNTARDVPRPVLRNCRALGCSHHTSCASGAATMRTALTRHIPLVLIEMKGSGKMVISGENLTSPDICDSKSNHFLVSPKSEISMHFRLKHFHKSRRTQRLLVKSRKRKTTARIFNGLNCPVEISLTSH